MCGWEDLPLASCRPCDVVRAVDGSEVLQRGEMHALPGRQQEPLRTGTRRRKSEDAGMPSWADRAPGVVQLGSNSQRDPETVVTFGSLAQPADRELVGCARGRYTKYNAPRPTVLPRFETSCDDTASSTVSACPRRRRAASRYGGPNRPAKSQRAGLSPPQRTQACFCRVSRSLSVLARVGCGTTSEKIQSGAANPGNI
jgi:hypothetical protein